MSKKNKPMDAHFQRYNMKRHVKRNGIELDLIDVKSLIDSSLYFPENMENIDSIIGISKNYGGSFYG